MSVPIEWFAALLVRSAVVVAAAALSVALLRRQSAAARHAVWAGALLALLTLPALTFVLPGVHVPVRVAANTVRAEFLHTGGIPPRAQAGGVSEGRRVQAPHTSAPTRRLLADWMPIALLALWGAGAVALVCRRLNSGRLAHRLVRNAEPASAEIARLCAAESARLGLRRAPAVFSSAKLAVPATTGALRPVVLIPAAAGSWTKPDIVAALLHELGHIRRRDVLTDLLVDVVTAVYWCNPAVWFARARMRAESERACDDLALLHGTDPVAYATLLLRAERACRHHPVLSTAAAMARPHQVESRIRAVLDERIQRAQPSQRLATVLATWGLIIAIPACSVRVRTEGYVAAVPPEPDRAGDALALPASERLPAQPGGFAVPAEAVRALQGPDSALVTRLISALSRVPQHDADLVRDRAAWALAQAGEGRLVEPLLAALRSSDWRVQSYAAWALTTAADPRAVPPLIDLLEHPVWRLRAMAAAALHESGDARAFEAMSKALADDAWQVRLEAVSYFLALGTPEAEELVRARRNDRHLAVRGAARGETSMR